MSQLETGKLKLGLAQRLDASLRDENVRWTSSMRAFAESQKTVVGDVLLASAFVALAGPFSKTYRDEVGSPLTWLLQNVRAVDVFANIEHTCESGILCGVLWRVACEKALGAFSSAIPSSAGRHTRPT